MLRDGNVELSLPCLYLQHSNHRQAPIKTCQSRHCVLCFRVTLYILVFFPYYVLSGFVLIINKLSLKHSAFKRDFLDQNVTRLSNKSAFGVLIISFTS